MYSGKADASSRTLSVTPVALQTTSPPAQIGRRGSLAVAKFNPFVPSPVLTLYRRATLLKDQTWFWVVEIECRRTYLKLVGTAATATAASGLRSRSTRIRPRTT